MTQYQILVADDDILILTTISNGLKKAGYDVIEAHDGEAAVRLGCELYPDLAVLDIRMPGISGIDAARALREKAGISSIFLTAHTEEEIVGLASEEGALGYLVKPVDTHQLIPSIKAALERSAEIKRLQQNGENLANAMHSSRDISVAIGIYMERYDVVEEEATRVLRDFARSESRKLAAVAKELVQATQHKNELINRIHKRSTKPKGT